jgi:hypothetical protein
VPAGSGRSAVGEMMRVITVRQRLLTGLFGWLSAMLCTAALTAGSAAGAAGPDLGPNVIVLNPSRSQATIQATLDRISTQQVPNQFGSQRYAIFFEPGTYGSASDPLDFQVGYYTQVAGLGKAPGDVVVNGAINVFNQCSGGTCQGTDNFWRSLSNLTLNVHLPKSPPAYAPYSGDQYTAGCDNSADMWAVSQAAPMRRVILNGSVVLQDYCSPQGYVSGGFFADDEFNGGTVGNDGQQQFFTRNGNIDSWSNGVWTRSSWVTTAHPPPASAPVLTSTRRCPRPRSTPARPSSPPTGLGSSGTICSPCSWTPYTAAAGSRR